MKTLIKICLTLLLSTVLLCTSNIAGTSEQGNARVIAIVYNEDGTPAAGASVRIRKTDYYTTTASNIQINAFTGPDGSFTIDSIDTGSYVIEVNDNKTQSILIPCSINTPDTLSLGNHTLKPYASVKGKIEGGSKGSKRFIQVKGLERMVEVADDGTYTIPDLPEGEFTLKIIEDNSSNTPLEIPDIVTHPSQITLAPFEGWLFSRDVYLNTTVSGAGISDDVYGFPVLIRLDSRNFPFKEAKADGSDIRFLKTGTDSTVLPSEIERWDPAGHAEIWVRVDTIFGNAENKSFIMQWGNPRVKNDSSIRPVFDSTNGFGGVYHLSNQVNSRYPDATPDGLWGLPANIGSTEGIIGTSAVFQSNEKSHITIENSSSGKLNFPADGYYTVSAWVNSDSVTGHRIIIGKGDLQYYLRIHNFNWHFAEYHDTPSKGWEFTASPYSFGTWVYLCCVRNGTSQYLYVNGVCVDSSITVMGDSDGARDTSFNLEIGRRLLPGGSDGLYFSGLIDEVRICSTARTSNWIRLSYINQMQDNLLVTFGK